ncbi:hypothetical protein BGZ46_005999 [Entomortierella lignicola]|nr:hypothetical protein BGZ46_005999 [Entomortierella lignicola]
MQSVQQAPSQQLQSEKPNQIQIQKQPQLEKQMPNIEPDPDQSENASAEQLRKIQSLTIQERQQLLRGQALAQKPVQQENTAKELINNPKPLDSNSGLPVTPLDTDNGIVTLPVPTKDDIVQISLGKLLTPKSKLSVEPTSSQSTQGQATITSLFTQQTSQSSKAIQSPQLSLQQRSKRKRDLDEANGNEVRLVEISKDAHKVTSSDSSHTISSEPTLQAKHSTVVSKSVPDSVESDLTPDSIPLSKLQISPPSDASDTITLNSPGEDSSIALPSLKISDEVKPPISPVEIQELDLISTNGAKVKEGVNQGRSHLSPSTVSPSISPAPSSSSSRTSLSGRGENKRMIVVAVEIPIFHRNRGENGSRSTSSYSNGGPGGVGSNSSKENVPKRTLMSMNKTRDEDKSAGTNRSRKDSQDNVRISGSMVTLRLGENSPVTRIQK